MGASTSTMRASVSSMEASISSLFGWQTIPPEDIPGRPTEEGAFLTVNLLNQSDLPDRGPLFCRTETIRLWDQLSEWACSYGEKSRIGLVRGAPGTGKTTTTFAWCQDYVKSTGKSVTWIHVSPDLVVYRVEFRESNGMVYYRALQEEFDTLANRIKRCSSRILVFDGFRELQEFHFIQGRIRTWAEKKIGLRAAVIISSFALSVRAEEKEKEKTLLDVFQKMSWTRDEYIAAFQCAKRDMPDSGFGKQVLRPKKRKIEVASSSISDDGTATTEDTDASEHTPLSQEAIEDIDEQFYFAGGCARYFFGFEKEDIKSSIDEAVECLNNTNMSSLLAQGSYHPHQRHRLLSFFNDGKGGVCKRIVSQYAVERLVEKCGEKAFTVLYGMIDDNPTFEGWVYEADFFFQYKKAKENNQPLVLDGDALESKEDVQIKPGNITTFDHDDMVHKVGQEKHKVEERGGVKSTLARGMSMMWKPKKWNQGGYDGFYVFTDPENEESVIIWFFQVTRGTSHKLNLKFFVQVIQLFLDAGLEVSDIQIYCVIPKNSNTQVPSVNPYGKLLYKKFGWANGQEKEKIHIVRLEKTPKALG